MLAERPSELRPAARGLPLLGEMPVGFRLPPADDTQETPYRLPKLAGGGGQDFEDLGGIYSRYGYTHKNPYENFGEKGESSFKWKYPLPTKSFRIYAGPSFREAVVAPSSTPRLVLPGTRMPQVNRLLGRSQTTLSGLNGSGGISNSNTRPTPVSRSAVQTMPGEQPHVQEPTQHQHYQRLEAGDSSVMGEEDSAGLQWVLHPQRHFQVDKKGQQRNQGPFSREFTIHAMAPPNWLRMKWGRRQQQHQQMMDGYRAVAVPAYYRQYTSFTNI